MKQLPTDLRRVVRRSILRRVIPCILLEAGLIAGLWFIGDDLLGDTPMHPSMIWGIYVLLLPVPTLVTGVPLRMRDKTRYGIVEEVKSADGLEFEAGVARKSRMYNTVVTTLTVRAPDGESFQLTVTHAGSHAQLKSEGYHVGDHVFHLYGSPHTVIIPTHQSDIRRCAVCYATNEFPDTACCHCGHTLLAAEMPEDTPSQANT